VSAAANSMPPNTKKIMGNAKDLLLDHQLLVDSMIPFWPSKAYVLKRFWTWTRTAHPAAIKHTKGKAYWCRVCISLGLT